jgi:hypothetical protein
MIKDDEIEQMKRKAVDDRLKDETVEVVMKRTGLRFKIDHHKTDDWVKELIRQGDPFTMVNLKTGRPICELAEDQQFKQVIE